MWHDQKNFISFFLLLLFIWVKWKEKLFWIITKKKVYKFKIWECGKTGYIKYLRKKKQIGMWIMENNMIGYFLKVWIQSLYTVTNKSFNSVQCTYYTYLHSLSIQTTHYTACITN